MSNCSAISYREQIRSWWCSLFTRQTCLFTRPTCLFTRPTREIWFFSTVRGCHVPPIGHIILIPSQPVFALSTHKWMRWMSNLIGPMRNYYNFRFFTFVIWLILSKHKVSAGHVYRHFQQYFSFKILLDEWVIVVYRLKHEEFYNYIMGVRLRVMVFNNNISVICGDQFYWRRNPSTCHWQILSHNVVLSTPRHERDSNSQLQWW